MESYLQLFPPLNPGGHGAHDPGLEEAFFEAESVIPSDVSGRLDSPGRKGEEETRTIIWADRKGFTGRLAAGCFTFIIKPERGKEIFLRRHRRGSRNDQRAKPCSRPEKEGMAGFPGRHPDCQDRRAGERIIPGIGDWPRAPEPKEGSGQRV